MVNENENNNTRRVAFPARSDLNGIVRVWTGSTDDIMFAVAPWEMQVDAFVNVVNECLQPVDPAAVTVFDAAGPMLEEECRALAPCATGEAKTTDAYRLPATKIIHTVGPRYAEKYRSAAENALSHCYRSSLECLVEAGLRTLAVGPIYSDAKGYPRDAAAHVAVRTIRRFLERWPDKIDAVVLCLPPDDVSSYVDGTLPLYFPRDDAEVRRAERELPADTGNDSGEMMIEERNLRISPFPGRVHSVNGPRPRGTGDGHGEDGAVDRGKGKGGRGNDAAGFHLGYGGVGVNDDSGFLGVVESPEERRQRMARAHQGYESGEGDHLERRDRCAVPASSVAGRCDIDHQAFHVSLVRRAKQLDLSDVALARAICVGGRDVIGRRVVSIVAAHLEPVLRAGDEQRVLMYAAAELAPVVSSARGYVLLYFHAGGCFGSPPSLQFVRRLHSALGPRHKETLRGFYVVHPTAMLKAAIWGMTTFHFGVSRRVFGRVEYIEYLHDLFRFVAEDQIEVPEHVREYDRDLMAGNV